MNDDLTTRLSRQLHEQVDDMHAAPLTFEQVRGRAHGIRRTRRVAVAGVAAAAVAAITVPTALMSGDLSGRPDRDLPPVNRATESPAPTPRADGTFPLTIPDGPVAGVPKTGYVIVDDQELVTPAGSFDLPGDFVQIAPYDGGWVGIRAGELPPTGTQVVVLDAELDEVSATPSAPALVSSADGSRLAWVEAKGAGDDWTMVNAPVDGGQTIRTPVSADTTPEGFLTEETVAFATSNADGEMSYGQAGPDGAFDARALSGYQRVGGISDAAGLVAGQTEFRGDSTCSEVRQTTSGEVVWRTCDYQLGAFSPDGALLIGLASYSDYGSPTLSVLDATTGRPVVEFTPYRAADWAAFVHEAVWEDDDSVIALVEQSGDQTLLRADLDGSLSRVADTRPTRDVSLEFHLPQHLFSQ